MSDARARTFNPAILSAMRADVLRVYLNDEPQRIVLPLLDKLANTPIQDRYLISDLCDLIGIEPSAEYFLHFGILASWSHAIFDIRMGLKHEDGYLYFPMERNWNIMRDESIQHPATGEMIKNPSRIAYPFFVPRAQHLIDHPSLDLSEK